MTTTRVLRSKLRHYLNTGTTVSPVWSPLNVGISSLSTSFNPEVEEEAYIADDSKTKYTTGLAPETSFDMNRVSGDAANDEIFELVWARSIGSSADKELLTVDMSATPTGTTPNFVYPAIKDSVNVQYDSIGDEAMKPLKIGIKLGHVGNPVVGGFDVGTSTFTAS